LQSDTIRLIYAYGDKDPAGSDLAPGDYHGNERGKWLGKVTIKKKLLIVQRSIRKKQGCCTKINNYLLYTKTGSKSILLLDQSGSAANAPDGETYNSFELLNNNFSLPAEDTYYNCRLFQLPTFSTKQHLVRVRDLTYPFALTLNQQKAFRTLTECRCEWCESV